MNGRISCIENIPTYDLLNTRLCDLKLNPKNSAIWEQIENLYEEISQKGIRFRPHVWISTSWFCPYGVPGFAIPFYLFHPRLARLEREYVGEVEGGTKPWLMRLLRHETGHAIDNAFHLRKSRIRQQVFGLSGNPYPLKYAPNKDSKDFVVHLDNHYAQAHPDEDWAETFAVWLDPKSNWRKKYKGWPALVKLELLDRLVTSIYQTTPIIRNKDTMEDLSTCTQTLREYFENKRRTQAKQNIISNQKLANSHHSVSQIYKSNKKVWIYM